MTGRQKGNDGPEKGRAPVSIAGVWGKGDGRREEVGLGKYDGRREEGLEDILREDYIGTPGATEGGWGGLVEDGLAGLGGYATGDRGEEPVDGEWGEVAAPCLSSQITANLMRFVAGSLS